MTGQLATLTLPERHIDGQALEDLFDCLATGRQWMRFDEPGDLGGQRRGIGQHPNPVEHAGQDVGGELGHHGVPLAGDPLPDGRAGPAARLATNDWRTNGAFWVRTSPMARSKVRVASSGSSNEASA